MRAFFDDEMNARTPTASAGARASTRPQQQAVVSRYEAALDRIEREGYHCAALLRRNYERGG